jgi:hypothetical protein
MIRKVILFGSVGVPLLFVLKNEYFEEPWKILNKKLEGNVHWRNINKFLLNENLIPIKLGLN